MKMEHPRLVSVAEDLVPKLLKPKSKTDGKLFTKKQAKQKQTAKEAYQIKPAKTANGKKPETKDDTANTTESVGERETKRKGKSVICVTLLIILIHSRYK